LPRMLRVLRASMIFLSAFVGVASTAKGAATAASPPKAQGATSGEAPKGEMATRRNCVVADPDEEGRASPPGVCGGNGCPGKGGGDDGTSPVLAKPALCGVANGDTANGAALPRNDAAIVFTLCCRSGLSRFVGVAGGPTMHPPALAWTA